ncbi:MAG: LPXTG cell wall anchor domain-containing protein [Aeromicrobium sp.]|uniref:LPXTG cell wall anchor domain-containing protein n=1 Tax=Aeromicrobium sp. TaxID=1871063 RepID=UPI0039E2FFF7
MTRLARWAILATLTLGLFTIGSAAMATQAPEPTLHVSTTTADPGDTIDVTGHCHHPGVQANELFVNLDAVINEDGAPPVVEHNIPVEPDGSVQGSFIIPATATPGEYRLSLTCYSDDQALDSRTFDFTVTGEVTPPATTPPPTTTPPAAAAPATAAPISDTDEHLPNTGSTVLGTLLVGVPLLAAGAALLLLHRRRAHTAP